MRNPLRRRDRDETPDLINEGRDALQRGDEIIEGDNYEALTSFHKKLLRLISGIDYVLSNTKRLSRLRRSRVYQLLQKLYGLELNTAERILIYRRDSVSRKEFDNLLFSDSGEPMYSNWSIGSKYFSDEIIAIASELPLPKKIKQ
jgi:hypothetical protein